MNLQYNTWLKKRNHLHVQSVVVRVVFPGRQNMPKIRRQQQYLEQSYLAKCRWSAVLKSIKNLKIHLQSCLWYLLYQMKYYLWKDAVTRKTQEWYYILGEVFDITAIRYGADDEKEIEAIVEAKSNRLESLISYCSQDGSLSSILCKPQILHHAATFILSPKWIKSCPIIIFQSRTLTVWFYSYTNMNIKDVPPPSHDFLLIHSTIIPNLNL